MAARNKTRPWLWVSPVLLLAGWLAPQYASKIWGESLGTFLSEKPLAGALVAQSFFVVLLAMPRGDASSSYRCASKPTGPQKDGILIALPLGAFAVLIHFAWFSSFSMTSVATNCVLWNTDTITTPFVAMLLTGKQISWRTVLGGVLGFVGTVITMGTDPGSSTMFGCALCLSASIGYAVYIVLVEKYVDPNRFSYMSLLGVEGIYAAVVICVALVGGLTMWPAFCWPWLSTLPSAAWIVFLGLTSTMLNLGWFWSTQLAGAFHTAMLACMTIPLTLILDVVVLRQAASLGGLLGSSLVILGFLVVSADQEAAADTSETARRNMRKPTLVGVDAPLLLDA